MSTPQYGPGPNPGEQPQGTPPSQPGHPPTSYGQPPTGYGPPSTPYGQPAAPHGQAPYGQPAAPHGQAPYGQPAAPHGQAPYGQPAGFAPPGYGQPYPGAAGGARPGVLTAAAVIAFVSGGLSIVSALLGFQFVDVLGGLYAVLVVLSLVAGAALIVGGVQALNGKDTKLLVILGGVSIALRIISIIWVIGMGHTATPMEFIGFVVPILIIVFCLKPESKAWVQSRGGTTF